MRVIVPYAGSYPSREVEAPLYDSGCDYELLDVSASDRAYFDLLSARWAAGDSFIVVEHDIVVHASAFYELTRCANDWCGFPHHMGPSGIQYGLGCVKFTAGLIARNPDAMVSVGVMFDGTHPKRHWCRLDAWLQGVILPQRDEVKCCHETVVKHLGNGCSHGCIPVP